MRFYRFFAIAIFSILIFASSHSIAQSNGDASKSLDDILNPKVETDDKPLTAALMANRYYKTCIEEKSLSFDDIEKDILCSCVAAKMSENLTVDEFKGLDKKTKAGKKARNMMLAYSYAPCMGYVINKKASTDCYISKRLDDIIIGKSLICKCVADRFKQHIALDAPRMIIRSQLYEPMDLNPLERYFMEKDYHAQHRIIMNQCRFDFEYHRDNKR